MARGMKAAEIVEVEDDDNVVVEEEKESEDWCFVCKDGGSLMVCDYKDCPKVYHANCIGKDLSGEGDSLICQWHKCYLCSKRPKLFCLCCPNAVCEGCVTHSDFIRLKEKKGLCNQCQEYVFALEKIQQYDADGDKIDLKDPDTVEFLFLEYWGIVKEEEDITFEDVQASSKSRKKGVKSKNDPSFTLSDVRSSKSQNKGVKRKKRDDPVEDEEDYNMSGSKSKRMEFIGWGSKPLIDFLTSIGEETEHEMEQHVVESVIRTYIRRENLLDAENKKRVVCDEKLYSIFRRKYVNHKRIYTLLNRHFKDNVEQFEHLNLMELDLAERKKNGLVPCKEQETEREADEEVREEEVKPEMRPTGLAVINAENIKLVYLRKSLIVELLKQNESFEDKVVGSFVKVRNHPLEYVAYQISQVTGIKAADAQSVEVILYVAGVDYDVSISRLEDSDIKEDEIEDLKQKVVNGLLTQPTLVEMEEKAVSLHEEITKHWITRQLTLLQSRINHANEKGWRKELEEYLDERELLQKPSEQERLMTETPKVIEELIEIEQEPEREAAEAASAPLDSSKQDDTSDLPATLPTE